MSGRRRFTVAFDNTGNEIDVHTIGSRVPVSHGCFPEAKTRTSRWTGFSGVIYCASCTSGNASRTADGNRKQQSTGGGQQRTVDEITKLKQNSVSGLRTIHFQNISLPFGTGTADSFSTQPLWSFRLSEN
jgi:hypothetical protein